MNFTRVAVAAVVAWVVIMLISFAAVWSFVVLPISGSLAAALTVDYIVEFAAYGMIVGAIYKPHIRPRGNSRPAGIRDQESGLGINGAQENRGAQDP